MLYFPTINIIEQIFARWNWWKQDY